VSPPFDRRRGQHLRRLALAAGLALAACTVPKLADLEKERPRECSSEHLCAAGYFCSNGLCVAGTGGDCTQGQTQACGSSSGECVQGQQSCGADGTWGPCVGEIAPVAEICDGKDNDCNGTSDDNISSAPLCPLSQGVCAGKRRRCLGGALESACTPATYGPDYQQAETACDGLDNDCNGQTDVGLLQACALQQGVCQGANQACRTDGGQCAASAYSSHNAAYELFETSCDGLDNDCDGRTDTWALQNLSNSPGVASTRATAARLSTGALLVMWQEGVKVRAVGVATDGTVSVGTEPSTTSESSARSFRPVVASDGPLSWAAWGEEAASSGTLSVRTAPVDANGRSTVAAAGAWLFPMVAGFNPVDLAVGVDGAALLALVVVQNGTALELASFGPAGQIAASSSLLGSGRRPSVAPAGSGAFWVAFQPTAPAQVSLCLVQAGTGPTITGSCFAAQAGGDLPTVLPLSETAPFHSQVSYLNTYPDGGAGTAQRACDAGVCANAQLTSFGLSASAAEVRAAPVSRTSGARLIAVENLIAAPTVVYIPSDGGAAVRAAPTLNSTRRPAPVMLGPGRAALVFDTEGNTGGGVDPNEVVLQRFCQP
jgi:Putative metal-binding motif